MDNEINFAPLEKALKSLKIASKQKKDEFIRDAVIQRFEYTYELTWKLLKRYLRQEAGIDEAIIKNLYREAARVGLIEDVDRWFSYHAARNLTAHTYNENTAEETYAIAKLFLIDAEKLLNHIKDEYRANH